MLLGIHSVIHSAIMHYMPNTIQRARYIAKVYAQLTFLWEEKVCVCIYTHFKQSPE